jgi:aspartyl-tRNA(Asn)/glutamyl-tRNA(Gln) amidotransferase subunit C
MENITAQSIKKIAKLARIEIAENSCDYLKSQVEATLLWTKQLNEVNTSNVEILTNVHNSLLRSAADKISAGGTSGSGPGGRKTSNMLGGAATTGWGAGSAGAADARPACGSGAAPGRRSHTAMKTSSGKQKSSKDSIEGLGLHVHKKGARNNTRKFQDAELRDLDLPRR